MSLKICEQGHFCMDHFYEHFISFKWLHGSYTSVSHLMHDLNYSVLDKDARSIVPPTST
jgi:hypothetical protein